MFENPNLRENGRKLYYFGRIRIFLKLGFGFGAKHALLDPLGPSFGSTNSSYCHCALTESTTKLRHQNSQRVECVRTSRHISLQKTRCVPSRPSSAR